MLIQTPSAKHSQYCNNGCPALEVYNVCVVGMAKVCQWVSQFQIGVLGFRVVSQVPVGVQNTSNISTHTCTCMHKAMVCGYMKNHMCRVPQSIEKKINPQRHMYIPTLKIHTLICTIASTCTGVCKDMHTVSFHALLLAYHK